MYFKPICFQPRLSLSSNYEIVFHDSQQSYLKWE